MPLDFGFEKGIYNLFGRQKYNNQQELHKHIRFVCGYSSPQIHRFLHMSNIVDVSCTPLGRHEMCVFHCKLSVHYLSFSANVKQGSDISPLLMTACGLGKD